MRRTAALLASLTLLGLLPSGAPASPTKLVRWPAAMPVADGTATATWADTSGRVHVLTDDQDADRIVGTLPDPSCDTPHVAAGRVVTLCSAARLPGAPLQVLDVASGTWAPIPDEGPILEAMDALADSEDAFRIASLGSAAVQLRSLNRAGARLATFSLATGARLSNPRGTRQVLDLDRPSGVARLCAPLSLRTFRYDDWGGIVHVPYPHAYRRPRLVTATYRRIWLSRCGERRPRLLATGDGLNETSPLLTRRYIAWTDRSALYVRRHGSGRVDRYRVPTVAGPARLTGTERRIWIDETSVLGQPQIFTLTLPD